MVLRKRIAALLLLVLTLGATPELLWQGAHSLRHHEHTGDSDHHDAAWLRLAKALVHGHHHAAGEPDHEHDLVPSPPLRQAAPSREVQAPDVASLADLSYAATPLSGAPPSSRRMRLSGASPPLLHLHCVLLI